MCKSFSQSSASYKGQIRDETTVKQTEQYYKQFDLILFLFIQKIFFGQRSLLLYYVTNTRGKSLGKLCAFNKRLCTLEQF